MEDVTARLAGFLASYGLLALFVVMLLKEAGLPIPIPSDLVMITAGIQAAAGAFTLFELGVAVTSAIVVGGTVQFLLVRALGRPFVQRFGRYVGLTLARLDRASSQLEQRGPLAVFLGLNLPAARAGIVVAAGLAGLPYLALLPALVLGSGTFYAWHIALGFLVGPGALALLEALNLPIAVALAGLAAIGLGGWALLRQRAAGLQEGATEVRSWTEAACPACLAATAVQLARPREAPAE